MQRRKVLLLDSLVFFLAAWAVAFNYINAPEPNDNWKYERVDY